VPRSPRRAPALRAAPPHSAPRPRTPRPCAARPAPRHRQSTLAPYPRVAPSVPLSRRAPRAPCRGLRSGPLGTPPAPRPSVRWARHVRYPVPMRAVRLLLT